MKIRKLKANHFTEPVGRGLDGLALSWIPESRTAKKVKTTRVEIATDEPFSNVVLDTGNRRDIDSASFVPGITLAPRTRYFWRVSVVADNGEKASSTSFFETGKMNEAWKGEWINAKSFSYEKPHFHVRREFTLDKLPSGARVYFAMLGVGELEVNGVNPTGEVLLPGYHCFRDHLFTHTADITKLLRKGRNVIGFHIGPGWYGSRMGWEKKDPFGDVFAVKCEVRAGGRLILASDRSWEGAESPVVKSAIYYGEDFDAAKEIADWSVPGTTSPTSSKNGYWQPVTIAHPDPECVGRLTDTLSPPLAIMETVEAVEIIKTPAGETVVDFGQNLTGWMQITSRAKKGETWQVQCGEVLQNGNFYRDNFRSAEAQYSYTSDGRVNVVRPHFTFFGFRFLKLNNFSQEIRKEDFKALVIHSQLDRVGNIVTDNAKVNRLFLNTLWGQKGNFIDVPVDCPQRDERLGWTGDTQAFTGAACFHMDSAAFYNKHISDMIEEQRHLKGAVPHIVPQPRLWRPADGECSPEFAAASGWADAATVVPWRCYERYADKAMLAKMYPAMKMWSDYMIRRDKETGNRHLRTEGHNFGDWLGLDNYAQPDSCHGGTDELYLASAYYAHSTHLTAQAAEVLGIKKDTAKYRKASYRVRTAIRKEFFTPNGRCAVDTQTAHVVALDFDLVPAEWREVLADRLCELIKKNGDALTTGFIGTIALCRVLSATGHNDVAYKLFLREDFPSWLYEVNLGATTIWERWNSLLPDGSCSKGKCNGEGMNSFNHYAYGAIADWMYQCMCGLKPFISSSDGPDVSAHGFKNAFVKPDFTDKLKKVQMEFDSPYGLWKTAWSVKGKTVTFSCTVPFNTAATLELPGAKARKLTAGIYKFTTDLLS